MSAQWVKVREGVCRTRTDDALAAFTHGYAYGILWANTYDVHEGEVWPEEWQTPSVGWELGAFTDDARATIEQDARDFFAANLRDLWAAIKLGEDWRGLGHDFALTRNRHGAGFWDRGTGEVGQRLTDAAHAYGDCTGIVDMGDDSARVSF